MTKSLDKCLFNISWATEEDMTQITRLTEAALAFSGSKERMDEPTRQELLHLVRLQCVLLLKDEDELAGFLAYADCRRWEDLPRGQVHLLHLHNHPDYDRAAVITSLLDRIARECNKHGIPLLTIAVPVEREHQHDELREKGYENDDLPQLLRRYPRHHHLVFRGEVKSENSTLIFLEDSLPGRARDGRLAFAKEQELTLEVSYESWETKGWVFLYEEAEVEVHSICAIAMTEHHLLHKEKYHRHEAERLLLGSMDVATRLGAKRVTALFTAGLDLADQPFERAVDFFGPMAERARDRELQIDIMAAPPRSCPIFSNPQEVLQLLKALEAPDVFGMRINASDLKKPTDFFSQWKTPIHVLQIDEMDKETPLKKWLRPEGLPELISIAFPQTDEPGEIVELINKLKEDFS